MLHEPGTQLAVIDCSAGESAGTERRTSMFKQNARPGRAPAYSRGNKAARARAFGRTRAQNQRRQAKRDQRAPGR